VDIGAEAEAGDDAPLRRSRVFVNDGLNGKIDYR
jgi:hypothetical protein